MEVQSIILGLSFKLRDFINNCPIRPPRECNLLEIIDPEESIVIGETKISRMLKKLFEYKNDFGNYPILAGFIKRFLSHKGLNVSLISQPLIEREKFNIDILIREPNKYAIIIENKIKDAIFQPNQLARYIQTAKGLGYRDDQIYVVVLPKNKIDTNYISEDVMLEPVTKYNFKKEFSNRTIFPQSEFSEWLEKEEREIPLRETNIRSALLQLSDYLNGLYGNKINKRFIMKKTEFLQNELQINLDLAGREKLDEVLFNLDETKKVVEDLQIRISHALIDQWYNSLKEDWPMMVYEPSISFGLNLKDNLWIGCRFNKDGDGDSGENLLPYWGFRLQKVQDKLSDEQKNMIKNILDYSGLDAQTNIILENGNLAYWETTKQGDLDCKILFSSARNLGYIES
ncbi:MAG: PD-(D/E)XK nuclease family protein [Muribaculaceae bacterium]|nr:PD-(D/E)XK nuclease family protein [Muribaculaceae bacterium]